jgi:hypothetical protein
MVALAVWVLVLPFRVAGLLGLRRTLIAGCLLILAITGYGVAQDLGALAAPARPRPAQATDRPARASAAARADIPPRYLRLYQRAARTCPGLPWGVLAAVGKLESDHGRSMLPGVRSGWNRAGAAGPMQFGIGKGAAGNAWARYGRGGNVYDPHDAIPAAARYLCTAGARGGRDVRGALFAYNHSRAYVAGVLAVARRYQPARAAGGGR